MITINMQYFGGNGASSGKSGGGGRAGGGGTAAKAEAKKEQQSSMRAFDGASTDEKLKMLREHNGTLEAASRNDGIGDEALWSHAKSSGTLMVEGKDYTTSDRGNITLKNRERLVSSKRVANQNDSVSLTSGSSSIYRGKDGNYYMATITRTGEQLSFGSIPRPTLKTELRRLPWKR